MKKYLSIVFVISLFIAIGATTVTNESSTTNAEADSVQKKGIFKNLKVLRQDISHEELDSVMMNWSVSLGVKCNFCHAASTDSTRKGKLDMASDAKPEKETARYMHTMTVGINDKFFSQTPSQRPDTIHAIICYTCHRGNPHVDAQKFLTLIDSTIDSKQRK